MSPFFAKSICISDITKALFFIVSTMQTLKTATSSVPWYILKCNHYRMSFIIKEEQVQQSKAIIIVDNIEKSLLSSNIFYIFKELS